MTAAERKTYVSTLDGYEDWYMVQPPATGNIWLVNLHGHGSNGDQIFTRPDIRDAWLPEIEKLGLGIVAPNLRDNAWMCPEAVADLHALLASVRAGYGAERFVLLSGSMGGTGSLIYTVRHPEDISAVAALCPVTDIAAYHELITAQPNPARNPLQDAITAAYGGTPAQVPERYAPHRVQRHAERLTMPVYLSHGDADVPIPVDQSRELYSVLKNTGADVAYDEIPGGGHDAPLLDGRVWEWLNRVLQMNRVL